MSKKKTELENAAALVVQKSGLNRLSFRTLADQVGIKSSSVHYYFPDKSDLAAILISNYAEGFTARLSAIDRDKTNAKAKLDAFIKIFENVNQADRICLCGMLAAEVSNLDDHSRGLLIDYFKQTEAWLRSVLDEYRAQINSPLSSLVLARLLMSGLEGALLLDRAEESQLRLKAQREFVKSLIN